MENDQQLVGADIMPSQMMEFWRILLSKIIFGGGIVFDLAKWLIFVLVAFAIFNTFFYAVFVVDGPSMEPNLMDKELVLWDKNNTQYGPARGDIVVVNFPGDPDNKKYVKRIIGLPGERVDVRNGALYINKKLLSENYLPAGTASRPDVTYTMKNNEYFIMGDNRPNSNDSRYFGPVERRFILGRAVAIVFPRFRLVKDI